MILHFNELSSTNSYLKEKGEELPPYTAVTASFQTAGRGQRGNSWESAPGENLLLSMLFLPPENIVPAQQFLISQAVSLGMVDALGRILAPVEHPRITVKWPNDIYIGDRKVAGILIENILSTEGKILRSIVGVGLNVNQREFRSPAPNPVSLIEFMNTPLDLSTVGETVVESLTVHLRGLQSCVAGSHTLGQLQERYLTSLWRSSGFHLYKALEASSAPAPTALTGDISPSEDIFEAEIAAVAPHGPITLRLRDGSLRTFAFKEVAPVLPPANP